MWMTHPPLFAQSLGKNPTPLLLEQIMLFLNNYELRLYLTLETIDFSCSFNLALTVWKVHRFKEF